MYFINDNLFPNKTKKPVQWNNLMLHFLLVDTLPIFFRFLPKYLEKRLVIVRKKLDLIKFISVSSEKKKNKNSWKYYLRTYLIIKLLSLLVVYAALSSQLFKHVKKRVRWLTIFKVLIKVLKKSRYVRFLLL